MGEGWHELTDCTTLQEEGLFTRVSQLKQLSKGRRAFLDH